MSLRLFTTGGNRRWCASRAGAILAAVGVSGSVLLSGCTKPPPYEAPSAYFQGASKKNMDVYRQAPAETGGNGVGATNPAAMQVASAVPPGFEVVAERYRDRPDESATFYVVIDPVDPTSEVFKQGVRKVLTMLATNNNGPVFSAKIFDHRPAVQTEVSYLSNPDLFSQDLSDARERFNSQHLVANYVGGLSSVGEPPSFVLFWYPAAQNEKPELEQWVSAEVWKP